MTSGFVETAPPAAFPDAAAVESETDVLESEPLEPTEEALENDVVTAVFGQSTPPMISESGGGHDGDGRAQCACGDEFDGRDDRGAGAKAWFVSSIKTHKNSE